MPEFDNIPRTIIQCTQTVLNTRKIHLLGFINLNRYTTAAKGIEQTCFIHK